MNTTAANQLIVLIRYLLLIILLAVSIKIFLNVYRSELGSWSLSELLINYQGGFVRRGLVGQIAYYSSDPVSFLTIVQRTVVSILIVALIAIVASEKNHLASVVLSCLFLFSSGGLIDFVQGGFEYLDRKEIWFYLAISCAILMPNGSTAYKLLVVLFVSVASVTLTLHHELYGIFCVAPTLVIMWKTKLIGQKWLLILLISCLGSLAFVWANHGNSETANLIAKSLRETHAIDIAGAIQGIGWEFEQTRDLSRAMSIQGSVLPWVYHLGYNVCLSLVAIILCVTSLREAAVYLTVTTLLITSTLIAMYIGWDWGRWISMFAMLNALFFAWLKKSNRLSETDPSCGIQSLFECNSVRYATASVVLLIFLFGSNLLIRMDSCCPQPASLDLRIP